MAENDDHMIEITSTDLTKALEDKAFEEAERIIKENRDPSYLNKGAYGAIPLRLVLSGEVGYRNLYLAQLLVKEGADVNIPDGETGETTPLEYVVNLYLEMKAINAGRASLEGNFSIPIIGLDRELNPPPEDLEVDCWKLIELFVDCGAVLFEFHSLVATKEPDTGLVAKLYVAGGDFNRQDIHGNTPLMDCVSIASRDSALPLFDLVMSSESSGPAVPELRLDHKNCNDETVLWRAMHAGSPQIAVNLIRHGAGVTDQAIVLPKCTASFAESFANSPILAHFNKAMSCDGIVSGLDTLLSSTTSFPMEVMVSNGIHPEDVAVLMLDSVECGLQQLCIRKVVEQLVKHELPGVELKEEETKNCDDVWASYSDELGKEALLVNKLNESVMKYVVKDCLNMPASLVPRFMIEAARLQLASILWCPESPDCVSGCDRDSDP